LRLGFHLFHRAILASALPNAAVVDDIRQLGGDFDQAAAAGFDGDAGLMLSHGRRGGKR
jgi:hypothetical protein